MKKYRIHIASIDPQSLSLWNIVYEKTDCIISKKVNQFLLQKHNCNTKLPNNVSHIHTLKIMNNILKYD